MRSSSGAMTAAANERAASSVPEPRGPTRRYAWTGRSAARCRSATARSWPTTRSHSLAGHRVILPGRRATTVRRATTPRRDRVAIRNFFRVYSFRCVLLRGRGARVVARRTVWPSTWQDDEMTGERWERVVGQDRAVALLRAPPRSGPVHTYLLVGHAVPAPTRRRARFAAAVITPDDDHAWDLTWRGRHPDVIEIDPADDRDPRRAHARRSSTRRTAARSRGTARRSSSSRPSA